MARIWYASLEEVMTTADIADSANLRSLVTRQCDAAADQVTQLTKRVFYPTVETRYFPWPQDRFQPSRRLYLGEHELVGAPTSVISGVGDGDEVIAPQYVHLAPAEDGPPFDTIVLDDNSNAVFQRGSTLERSIAVDGPYGYMLYETQAAVTATALSGTTVTVSSTAGIGTGTLLRVGDERLLVTGRRWVDTGNIEPVTLAKDKAATQVTVTNGGAYSVDEELLIDAERVLLTDIAGNTLVVRRAVAGTVLAAHTAVFTLYAQRGLAVARAQLGTAAVDQPAAGVAVLKFVFPGLISNLFVAEAVVGVAQARASYARMTGAGDNAAETVGRGLKDLRDQVVRRYRRYRSASV